MHKSNSINHFLLVFLSSFLSSSAVFATTTLNITSENNKPYASSPSQMESYQDSKLSLEKTVSAILPALPSLSSGSVYYVSNDGSDKNNGSQNGAWKTLKYAVSKLKAGDTLYLTEGTYKDTADFISSGTQDKLITIQGIGNVWIDNSASYIFDPAFDTNGQSYIQFKNINVRNSRAGVLIGGGSHHVTVNGLNTDHAQFAVLIKDASFVTFLNATADNSRHAFRAEGVSHDLHFENIKAFRSQDV